MPTFIGIDPGKTGSIAALMSDGEVYCSLPLGKMTEADLWHWLAELEPAYCVLEKVSSSPQMGVVSSFTFGRGYGLLCGLLTAACIPFVEVTPNTWMTKMKCKTGGNKIITKRKSQQLFPQLKITHRNADALLIATYCKQNHKDLF